MQRVIDPNLYLDLVTALQIVGVQVFAIILFIALLRLYSHFEDF